DDAGGRHRAHVGALVDRGGLLAGRHVDGPQGARDRADRLHRSADPQHLPRAHPALGATGAERLAADAAVRITHDLVVGLAPAPGCRAEPLTDLDTLDRLDAPQRPPHAPARPA